MKHIDLYKLYNIIEDVNDNLDFDIIMFVASDKKNMKGGIIVSDFVKIKDRKIDIVDMIGYMLKNAEVSLEDIEATMRLKKEEIIMLGLVKLIEEVEN